MKATQRLYLTSDRKALVENGHKKAATLYCVPGDEIPQSAADRFGLVGGALPTKGGTKEDKGGKDKEDKGGKDKGGNGGQSNPAPDDLTKIAGVDAPAAELFAAAGFETYASLAAIDPATPPEIDGLPAYDWTAIQAAAEALATTAPAN